MKLFRRITTLTIFGAGFLLGSRSGREAWEKAQAKFNEFSGKAKDELENNPQVKQKVEQAKSQIQQKTSSMTGDSMTGGTADLREGQLTEI